MVINESRLSQIACPLCTFIRLLIRLHWSCLDYLKVISSPINCSIVIHMSYMTTNPPIGRAQVGSKSYRELHINWSIPHVKMELPPRPSELPPLSDLMRQPAFCPIAPDPTELLSTLAAAFVAGGLVGGLLAWSFSKQVATCQQ